MSCTPGQTTTICAQQGCTDIPPVAFVLPRRVGPLPPAGFSTEPRDFVADYWADMDEEERGFWHVSVDGPGVLETGLKSRRELGNSKIGLGGGYNNQSPDRVSITYSPSHAQRIAERMVLAVRAARGEIGVREIINSYESETGYSLEVDQWADLLLGGSLSSQDFYSDDLDESELFDLVLERAEDEFGASPYELVVTLEDNLGRHFMDEDSFVRVGFTASAEKMAQVDPERVTVFEIAVSKNAPVEVIPEERELRVTPEHLWVIHDS